ncbi:MAG: sulfotransferase domain-containing protein [Verrucomicrobiota bacterium]
MPDTRKLSFIGLGPQRTASSWLDKRLRDHPRLRLPAMVKETMFFDERYDKGMDWYWSHFEQPEEDVLYGEIAPTYFDVDEVRQRIKVYEGLKLIINLRNPIARAYSLYNLHLVKGRVEGDYFSAISQMPRIETSGAFSRLCPQWEEAFGQDNVLYLVQEDIIDDPQKSIDRVTDFLGIEAISLGAEAKERFNKSYKPRYPTLAKWSGPLTTRLREYRLHYVVEFAKKLGMKKILHGGEDNRMPKEVFEHLAKVHAEDITYVEERLGCSFPQWRDYDYASRN